MKKRKKIEEDAKRVVLPNAKNGIEIKEDAKYAKQLVSAMSSAYEVEDFWKIMGMVMFTSKNDFTIQDYPNTPFKIYIVYSNVNHKLSIRYKINGEETNEFTQTGHRWLEGRGVKVGEALKLIKDSGFLPPSVETISEVNGDDIFDDLRIELSKYTDDSEDEEPTNIIKMNVKENRNMNKKQVIRLTESQFHQIVKESVNRILNEQYGVDFEDTLRWVQKKKPDMSPEEQEQFAKNIIRRREHDKYLFRISMDSPKFGYQGLNDLSWNEAKQCYLKYGRYIDMIEYKDKTEGPYGDWHDFNPSAFFNEDE